MYKKYYFLTYFFLLLTLMIFLFFTGVIFHKTAARYFCNIVDYIYDDQETSGPVIKLSIRSIQRSRKLLTYDDENDHQIIEKEISVSPSKVGLLLIDVWDVSDEGNDSYRIRTERRTREYIVPLLRTARNGGMKVFHSPNNGPMSKNIKVLEGEVDLNWLTPYPRKFQTLYFYWLAKSMGINTLLIAGYDTSACVFLRPIGIKELCRFGIKLILVRDATHNWEYEDYEKGTTTKTFIQILEVDYLPSTTTGLIKNSFDNLQ